jgi:Kinesin motor domain
MVKHLFLGYDVTFFAYGSTGTGKTYTMRGGKSLGDRGMIPRLLSSIYRKSRAIEKSSNGETTVDVLMSYYEIYNDRVFDLFESPEQRTTTGLPIREAEGGKTVVVGLTEVPCSTLKEFEGLYDKANSNRSTGATKLNAHSSRSHAILCVKVTITSPTETRVSTASAIDLAGSEDNRRTGNGKDRMVESASINKSLFVLAQCVEAISKKQARIPYRESKMTRILSLGQNNGFTVMILNLAPVKSYHLDTVSSLNFANRTKKIEVREVENDPIFKGPPRPVAGLASSGPTIQRQPLRPLMNGANVNLGAQRDVAKATDKPMKAFSVYSDKSKPASAQSRLLQIVPRSPLKRSADSSFLVSSRSNKTMRPTPSFIQQAPDTAMTKSSIESIVEQKVTEILAARTLNAPIQPPTKDISSEVQRRLDSIEQRLAGQDGERAEGLSYLFMAKQHQARGENGSALKMYQLAQPYFPENEKLMRKIESLKAKLDPARAEAVRKVEAASPPRCGDGKSRIDEDDASYHEYDAGDRFNDQDDDESFHAPKPKKSSKPTSRKPRISSPDPLCIDDADIETTPRTRYLLSIINTRDVAQMTLLHGLGAKRAESIVECLRDMDELHGERRDIRTWEQLGRLRGIGKKTLESMRFGVEV